jgi:hypothetical protein
MVRRKSKLLKMAIVPIRWQEQKEMRCEGGREESSKPPPKYKFIGMNS